VIHAVTPYGRQGPSSRVRVFEWLDRTSAPFVLSSYISHRNARPSYIARRPFSVLAAERRLRRMAARRPRRLLLHREASPLSRGDLERRLIESSQFAVYDFDDALQWDWGAGGRVRRLAPKAPKALIAVQRADRVIAGNPVLAEWASQHNADVIVIPSCVSPNAYREKRNYEVSDPPRLGWIGSPDNEVYLRLIEPALREIHRRTGARLTLIGTTRPNLGDLELFIDRLPWSEASQHQLLANLDVGIAPLPDEPYTRGKCGYRLLQYAAAGTPIVASPVGVNRQILSQLRMPAPEDQREWADAILDLLTMSAAARESLGRRARAVTQRHYSYDAWLFRWQQAVGIADSASAEREAANAAPDARQTA
jgi:glycosyltransferase involved in cell wall biosynthesis